MTSRRNIVIAGATALSVAVAALSGPAFAGAPSILDGKRLDAAHAEYSYYRGNRGGWRGGNRGAAIAAGVGLGILGAAAIAASRPAYADPYDVDDDYVYEAPPRAVYYEPAPVYDAPVYAPPRYYGQGYGYGPGPRYHSRPGVDPARGGR